MTIADQKANIINRTYSSTALKRHNQTMKTDTNTDTQSDSDATSGRMKRLVRLLGSKAGRTNIIFALAVIAWVGWSCVEHGIVMGLLYIILGVLIACPFIYIATKIISKAPND